MVDAKENLWVSCLVKQSLNVFFDCMIYHIQIQVRDLDWLRRQVRCIILWNRWDCADPLKKGDEVGGTVTKTIYTAQIQYIRIRQRLRNTSTGAIVEPTLRYDDTGAVEIWHYQATIQMVGLLNPKSFTIFLIEFITIPTIKITFCLMDSTWNITKIFFRKISY